jgi:multidrug efflux system outer membrane protein
VADGLAGRQTLDDQFRSEQLLVQASQANYELASQRFRAGIDDNLAELDAQRALFSAQQTLVQTRLARMSNLVNLYKALGADGQKALRLSHNSPGRLTPLSGDKVGNTWVEDKTARVLHCRRDKGLRRGNHFFYCEDCYVFVLLPDSRQKAQLNGLLEILWGSIYPHLR